jgi:hypothetical protein
MGNVRKGTNRVSAQGVKTRLRCMVPGLGFREADSLTSALRDKRFSGGDSPTKPESKVGLWRALRWGKWLFDGNIQRSTDESF